MTKDFNVSVSMNQAAPVKTGVVLKQGDFGFDLKITVLDFTVTGTTPQIVFRKPMGAVESTDVTASGNVYTYTFKGTELDTPGKVFCDLKLKNSTTQRISTASFQFECIADTLDGLAEESSSYSDTIAQLMDACIQKSETSGLVKNDGTIDTNQYALSSTVTALNNEVSTISQKVDINEEDISSINNSLTLDAEILSHNILDTTEAIGTQMSAWNGKRFYIGNGLKWSDVSNGKNNITLGIEFTDSSSSVGIQYKFVYTDGTLSGTALNPNTMYSKNNISNYENIVGVQMITYSAANPALISKFGLIFNAETLDLYNNYIHSWDIDKLNYYSANNEEEIEYTLANGVLGTNGQYNTGENIYKHAIVPCKEGETYEITGYSFTSTGYPAYYFLNLETVYSASEIISYGETGLGSMVTEKAIAPKGARYICVNISTNMGEISISKLTSDPDSEIIETVQKSYWAGKKIVWFGTSIPAGVVNAGESGGNGAYPTRIGELLGATVYNESVGSSDVRSGTHGTYVTEDDPMGYGGVSAPGLMLSLSLSSTEKQSICDNWTSKWQNIITYYGDRVDMSKIEEYKAASWDIKLAKYLTGGSVGPCDLYVFDHGYNDVARDEGYEELDDIPETQTDRRYWIGAMSFLFEKIYADNPKAKIIIVGHYSLNQRRNTNVDSSILCDAQTTLANYWSIPIIKTWEHVGFSFISFTSGGETITPALAWMPDGIHPASDTTGKTLQYYAEVLYPLFRDLR